MSDYRRYYVAGGMSFFTVVAYGRRPILTTDDGRRLLRSAIQKIRQRRPFELFATVLLPDHWHLIMELPSGDAEYPTRMKRIKEEFTASWLRAGLPEATVTPEQADRGERGIWQPRFWEHTIRDEDDLQRCVDYIGIRANTTWSGVCAIGRGLRSIALSRQATMTSIGAARSRTTSPVTTTGANLCSIPAYTTLTD